MAQLGDLDDSGATTLAVGAINASAGALGEAGTVRVFNRIGIEILTLEGDQEGQGLGWSVADIGDWDGDGTPEVELNRRFIQKLVDAVRELATGGPVYFCANSTA